MWSSDLHLSWSLPFSRPAKSVMDFTYTDVCPHTHIVTHMHRHTVMHTYAHTHTYTDTYIQTCHTHSHTYIGPHTNINISHTHTHIYVHVHTICTHTYTSSRKFTSCANPEFHLLLHPWKNQAAESQRPREHVSGHLQVEVGNGSMEE